MWRAGGWWSWAILSVDYGEEPYWRATPPPDAGTCHRLCRPRTRAPDRTESTWTTELEYRFGDAFEGDAIFHFIRSVRVDGEGERVFTVETALSRVSVWTPEGELLVEVGRPGAGPGDFAWADDLFPDD